MNDKHAQSENEHNTALNQANQALRVFNKSTDEHFHYNLQLNQGFHMHTTGFFGLRLVCAL